jgi:ABC-type spermidine/putrescine transport system permease subunit II
MLSFDEFIITNFVIGNESTLPLLIASRLRRTVDPTLNVISTLLVAGSFVVWSLAFVAVLRKEMERRRRSEAALGVA